MNLFWMDASALAKRYVSEIGSPLMNHLFGRVPPLGMIGLLEGVGGVISILVRHRNAGRITQSAFHHALLDFRSEVSHCDDVEKVHPTPTQVSASWKHSGRYSLNSTDAVILRCALDKIIELRAGGNDLVWSLPMCAYRRQRKLRGYSHSILKLITKLPWMHLLLHHQPLPKHSDDH
jgi:predicted nucleic acid-binding protein